jgi:hypothetical protein
MILVAMGAISFYQLEKLGFGLEAVVRFSHSNTF